MYHGPCYWLVRNSAGPLWPPTAVFSLLFMGKYHRFKIPVSEYEQWRSPVRRPPVSVDGVKIGDSLPAVTRSRVVWRDVVSDDGLRKVGGVACLVCVSYCNCTPIKESERDSLTGGQQ